MLYNLIKHISYTRLIYRGNRKWLAKSKVVKFEDISLLFNRIIYLIYHQNHRFLGLSKHVSYLIVRIYKTSLNISYKYNYICRIYGNLSLLTHICKHHVTCIRLDTTCIYHSKGFVKPLCISVYPIPGYTGCILYYGYVAACKFIKKCRLPYIRSSYYRYYWFQITPQYLYYLPLLCNFTLLCGVCKGWKNYSLKVSKRNTGSYLHLLKTHPDNMPSQLHKRVHSMHCSYNYLSSHRFHHCIPL